MAEYEHEHEIVGPTNERINRVSSRPESRVIVKSLNLRVEKIHPFAVF